LGKKNPPGPRNFFFENPARAERIARAFFLQSPANQSKAFPKEKRAGKKKKKKKNFHGENFLGEKKKTGFLGAKNPQTAPPPPRPGGAPLRGKKKKTPNFFPRIERNEQFFFFFFKKPKTSPLKKKNRFFFPTKFQK